MDWKKLLHKSLYPPAWLVILLTLFCIPALILIFISGWSEHPAAAILYALSAYTVTVLTLACVRVVPSRYQTLRQILYAHPVGNRYMTDVAFKTHISLYRSLAVNLLYVAANIISGLRFRSAWFLILAGYYATLSVMRFLLLRYVHRNVIGKEYVAERKRSRLCAVILLLLNLSVSGTVMMILYQGKGFDYPGILIYAMAAYTFYITIAAIRNLIKYRKYRSPILSTAKVINLAAALVSTLSLETAMLTQFGAENQEPFRHTMVAATGAGISVIMVVMTVYIITRNTREIRRYYHGTA